MSTEANRVRPPTYLHARVLRILWPAFAAWSFATFLGVLAIEFYPHARGIGFPVALRFAMLALVCAALSLCISLLHIYAETSTISPSGLFAVGCIALFVVLSTISAYLRIPLGISIATYGTVVFSLWLLVPFLDHHKSRSHTGPALLALLGVLEVICFATSLSTERISPPAMTGSAFDIPRAMFDAHSRFLTLPSGAKIHYVDEGSGPVLLFLHGNPSWSFQWRNLIKALKTHYRCVALDYPGFGMSDAPPGFGFTPADESRIVEEFADQLRLQNITLVMQDWGGPIGLAFAERRPDLIQGVILGSTWAWPTDNSVPRGKFSLIAGGPIGEFIQMNFNGFSEFGIRQGINRRLPSDVMSMYMRPSQPPHRRGVEAFYPDQITSATVWFQHLQTDLPRLKDKPALIFWALQDPGFSLQDLARFESTFPNHRTIRFPSANHFFFEDQCDAMIPQIRTFMSENSTNARAH